ncbi:hypothetical protein VDGD_06724 [Verticillium dahliae]|nr:3',5'-cyclic-nucleotide phosphodiesterase [Verticillium dahliae VDG1]RBR00723.1 hypothetical protein VDGD_06724 [Verticillium dahliae]
MRFTFVAALGLVASVFATPLAKPIDTHPEKRQLESQASVIETLRQEVISQTTLINASLADASEDPGQAEVSALAGVINPALEAITAAIGSATSNVNRGRRLQRQEDGEEEESCDAQCLTERVLEVVYEIVSTVRAVIERIGLGPVLLRVNPLLLALSALVLALNVLVTGLLVTVTAVVTTVLGGLGLGLLLLGWG